VYRFGGMKHRRGLRRWAGQNSAGQSLVEMAIALPILLIMLIGVFEVGWALRGYIVLTNVNREAARFAVKRGTLDYSIEDPTTVGYEKVLSHTLGSLSEQLPLNFYEPDPNNTMIISHFVADTMLPCARVRNDPLRYEFDNSCDCSVDDPYDAQWFTRDDLIAYPGDLDYPHYYQSFGISQTTRINYQQRIDEMILQNNKLNCALLKSNPDASLATSANNMIIIEHFYDQPQLVGVPFISNRLTDPIPLYTHTAMRIITGRDIDNSDTIGPACEVYPLTFPERLLSDPDLDGNVNFDPFNPPSSGIPIDALEGDGEGNFGWLNWNPGNNDNVYLVEELFNPRLSMHDFTGLTPPPPPTGLQADETNTDLNRGDWVSGLTDVDNSDGIQSELVELMEGTTPIRVPIYDQVDGTGQDKGYHVSHFALITINQVCLPSDQCGQSLGLNGNDKKIFATFHGFDDEACGG